MTQAAIATPTDFDSEIITGNFYPKYETRNPIARHLVDGFLTAFDDLVAAAAPKDILEVGCGEGFLTTRMAIRQRGSGNLSKICGIDIGADVVELATSRAAAQNVGIDFLQRSVYDLEPQENGADLVVACEMLEHLDEPVVALEKIAELTQRHAILSVPREPIWRLLNMARGKYLGSLGNTPGHLQSWSAGQFIRLVERHFDIVEIRKPLPWTIVLCRAR